MVFGWSKKSQENSEQQTTPSQSKQLVRIPEIHQILEKQREDKQKKVLEQTKALFDDIKKELNAIYGIITHLKNDDLKIDDIDNRLKILVTRSKAEVIEIIFKESQKQLPQVKSYGDVLNASEIASYTLKKIGDVLGKHSRVIHVFAKKYAQDLKAHLGLVTKNHTMISKLIGQVSSLESSIAMIKDKTEKITSTAQSMIDNTRHIAKLKESYGDAEVVASLTQQQISNIFSSPTFAKFLEYQEKIKQVEAMENNLNKQIDEEFSKISRPLGKYVYVTSLEKPLKTMLERLVERPSEVIMGDKNAIVTILESCMKGIMSGAVSVKETDKSVDHITHTLSLLDGFRAKKNELHTQIQELRKNLESFDISQIETLERRLAKAKSDREDAKLKIANLESELKRQTEQKQNLVEDLERALEQITGKKYQVVPE
ncbi:MAG: hypothetical protein WAO91_06620 [Candidatus Nitrosotenuis sp.]